MKRKANIIRNKKAQSLGSGYLIFFLILDALLVTGGFVSGFGIDSPFNNYIDTNTFNENGTIEANRTIINELIGASNATSGARPGLFAPVFDLGIILLFGTKLLVKFMFAPLFALQSMNAPILIVLIFGVIPSIMFVITIVSFIRGKDF